MSCMIAFESLAPEVSETLESALQLPSQKVMRNGSNQRFFRKWLNHRNQTDRSDEKGASDSSHPTNARRQKSMPLVRNDVSKKESPPVPTLLHRESANPQDFLDRLLRSRGYSTKHYRTLDTAYHSNSTPLQLASYGNYLVDLVRSQQKDTISAILNAGISPNPCNGQGESLVHMVARRGDAALLKIFHKAGCRLDQADELGRTTLHDAFWASEPSFETVELLLEEDRCLLHMADCRDALPLSFARKEHWAKWIEFFETKKDQFWPIDSSVDNTDPPLACLPPNSRPVQDPGSALTPELAAMVVNGVMDPEEALMLRHDNIDGVEDETERGISMSIGMQVLTERSFDENDMADILATLSAVANKRSSLDSMLVTTSLQEYTPEQASNPIELLNHSQTLMDSLLDGSSSDEDSSDYDDDKSIYDDSESSEELLGSKEMDDLLAGLASVKGPTNKSKSEQLTSEVVSTKIPKQMNTAASSLEISDDDDDEEDSSFDDDSEQDDSEENDLLLMARMPIRSSVK